MGRVALILLAVLAIPWAISTWWQMRRARSPQERSFIGRTSLGLWMFLVFAAIFVGMLGFRGQLIALPLLIVGGFAVRHGLKKVRARLAAQANDPLSRARRLN